MHKRRGSPPHQTRPGATHHTHGTLQKRPHPTHRNHKKRTENPHPVSVRSLGTYLVQSESQDGERRTQPAPNTTPPPKRPGHHRSRRPQHDTATTGQELTDPEPSRQERIRNMAPATRTRPHRHTRPRPPATPRLHVLRTTTREPTGCLLGISTPPRQPVSNSSSREKRPTERRPQPHRTQPHAKRLRTTDNARNDYHSPPRIRIQRPKPPQKGRHPTDKSTAFYTAPQ